VRAWLVFATGMLTDPGDMFACCDSSSQSLDLHETSGELASLLRLLHDPPAAPTEEQVEDRFRPTQYDPKTVVPLPILRSVLFPLADKYLVDDEIIQSLRAHVLAHASAHPLEVYGFATNQGWDWEASSASQFVQPMASYALNEIAETIPNVVAYHRLVLLQDTRVRGMRDLLLGEQIFPSGAFPLFLPVAHDIMYDHHVCRIWSMFFASREHTVHLGPAT